jgi:hypothetical protein
MHGKQVNQNGTGSAVPFATNMPVRTCGRFYGAHLAADTLFQKQQIVALDFSAVADFLRSTYNLLMSVPSHADGAELAL